MASHLEKMLYRASPPSYWGRKTRQSTWNEQGFKFCSDWATLVRFLTAGRTIRHSVHTGPARWSGSVNIAVFICVHRQTDRQTHTLSTYFKCEMSGIRGYSIKLDLDLKKSPKTNVSLRIFIVNRIHTFWITGNLLTLWQESSICCCSQPRRRKRTGNWWTSPDTK